MNKLCAGQDVSKGNVHKVITQQTNKNNLGVVVELYFGFDSNSQTEHSRYFTKFDHFVIIFVSSMVHFLLGDKGTSVPVFKLKRFKG